MYTYLVCQYVQSFENGTEKVPNEENNSETGIIIKFVNTNSGSSAYSSDRMLKCGMSMHLEYLSSATNDTKIGAHAHCVGYSEEILNPPHRGAKYHSILKRSYLSVRGDTDACTIDSFPRKINSTKISSA
jgi:hypothetical protein